MADTVTVVYRHADGTHAERVFTAERMSVQTWKGGRALLVLHCGGRPCQWVFIRCYDEIVRSRTYDTPTTGDTDHGN
jgi:hypothetical protein